MRRWEIEREDDYGYDMTVIMAVIVPPPTSWHHSQTMDELGSRRVVGGRLNKTRIQLFQDWNIRSIDSRSLGNSLGSAGDFGLPT
jgi:hypothetical protein